MPYHQERYGDDAWDKGHEYHDDDDGDDDCDDDDEDDADDDGNMIFR